MELIGGSSTCRLTDPSGQRPCSNNAAGAPWSAGNCSPPDKTSSSFETSAFSGMDSIWHMGGLTSPSSSSVQEGTEAVDISWFSDEQLEYQRRNVLGILNDSSTSSEPTFPVVEDSICNSRDFIGEAEEFEPSYPIQASGTTSPKVHDLEALEQFTNFLLEPALLESSSQYNPHLFPRNLVPLLPDQLPDQLPSATRSNPRSTNSSESLTSSSVSFGDSENLLRVDQEMVVSTSETIETTARKGKRKNPQRLENGDAHNGDAPEAKKPHDNTGVSKDRVQRNLAGSSKRLVREPRYKIKTRSDVDVMDDGYRWRKYGQKPVKNGIHPRNYYRCTTANCPVRKRVERSNEDPGLVLTSYEGIHDHPNANSDIQVAPPVIYSRSVEDRTLPSVSQYYGLTCAQNLPSYLPPSYGNYTNPSAAPGSQLRGSIGGCQRNEASLRGSDVVPEDINLIRAHQLLMLQSRMQNFPILSNSTLENMSVFSRACPDLSDSTRLLERVYGTRSSQFDSRYASTLEQPNTLGHISSPAAPSYENQQGYTERRFNGEKNG